MLSKYLIQFSADGWDCVPFSGQTMVGVMAVIATFFKRIYASMPQLPCLLQPEPLSLQQVTADPCLGKKHSLNGRSGSVSRGDHCSFPSVLLWWGFVCLTQWNYEPCHIGPPKTDGSWWRVLTKCGPLVKGMANHFSIVALRTHEHYDKAKRYDTKRWALQVSRCPIY